MENKVSVQNGVLAEKRFHRLLGELSGLLRKLVAILFVRRCSSASSVRSLG